MYPWLCCENSWPKKVWKRATLGNRTYLCQVGTGELKRTSFMIFLKMMIQNYVGSWYWTRDAAYDDYEKENAEEKAEK